MVLDGRPRHIVAAPWLGVFASADEAFEPSMERLHLIGRKQLLKGFDQGIALLDTLLEGAQVVHDRRIDRRASEIPDHRA